MRAVMTGAEAVAEAMRQVEPDVVAAYPITPQTPIVMRFSEFVANGLVRTELVTVESEHSAMSACVGAAASGARAMTATAANGLALMWEIVYIAASMRLPIVMPVASRALSGPINIHCDHSDIMGARDSGWIIMFSENPQEAYDNTIQAVRIGEHPDVRLPVMVNLDGFIVSHTMMNVETLPDEKVKEFVGEPKSIMPLLPIVEDFKPVTYGPVDLFDYYFEHKRQQIEAMKHAKRVIVEVGEEYGKISGRKYGLYEPFKLEDAEVVVVAAGSATGTAKVAVDMARKEGIKAGLLKIRVFRPFPANELVEAIRHAKAVAVLDRSVSFGNKGPIFMELSSAAYERGATAKMVNYIYGLGGREITPEQIYKVIKLTAEGRYPEHIGFVNLRDAEIKEEVLLR